MPPQPHCTLGLAPPHEVFGSLCNFLKVFGSFLKVLGDGSVTSSLPTDQPSAWQPEQHHLMFEVVDAGKGQISLHAVETGRFLRIDGKHVDASIQISASDLPTEWGFERYTVVDAGDGLVALHNRAHNRFLRLHWGNVNAGGGVKDATQLPSDWGAERFKVM